MGVDLRERERERKTGGGLESVLLGVDLRERERERREGVCSFWGVDLTETDRHRQREEGAGVCSFGEQTSHRLTDR